MISLNEAWLSERLETRHCRIADYRPQNVRISFNRDESLLYIHDVEQGNFDIFRTCDLKRMGQYRDLHVCALQHIEGSERLYFVTLEGELVYTKPEAGRIRNEAFVYKFSFPLHTSNTRIIELGEHLAISDGFSFALFDLRRNCLCGNYRSAACGSEFALPFSAVRKTPEGFVAEWFTSVPDRAEDCDIYSYQSFNFSSNTLSPLVSISNAVLCTNSPGGRNAFLMGLNNTVYYRDGERAALRSYRPLFQIGSHHRASVSDLRNIFALNSQDIFRIQFGDNPGHYGVVGSSISPVLCNDGRTAVFFIHTSEESNKPLNVLVDYCSEHILGFTQGHLHESAMCVSPSSSWLVSVYDDEKAASQRSGCLSGEVFLTSLKESSPGLKKQSK